MPKKTPFKVPIPRKSDFNAPSLGYRRIPDCSKKSLESQRAQVKKKILAQVELTPEELAILSPQYVNRLREQARREHGGMPKSTGNGLDALKRRLEPILQQYRDELDSGGSMEDKETHAAMQFAIIDTAETIPVIQNACRRLQEIFGMQESKIRLEDVVSASALEDETMSTLQRLRASKGLGKSMNLAQSGGSDDQVQEN